MTDSNQPKRGPGRPAKSQQPKPQQPSPAAEQPQEQSQLPPRAAAEQSREPRRTKRKQRIPLGTHTSKLSFEDAEFDPNYVYRVVNDDNKGRLGRAQAGGYEFVTEGVKMGNAAEDGNTDLGSRVSRIVGTNEDGSPMRAYLMRIERDLYEEDQEAKQDHINEVDDQIRHGNMLRQQDREETRYIPRGGINIRTTKARVARDDE